MPLSVVSLFVTILFCMWSMLHPVMCDAVVSMIDCRLLHCQVLFCLLTGTQLCLRIVQLLSNIKMLVCSAACRFNHRAASPFYQLSRQVRVL